MSGQRVTLPALMQEVQTFSRFGLPETMASYPLDVRVPAPVGLLLGPGDVMAEPGPLAAYVTYRSHWSSLPNYVDQCGMPDVGNRKRVPDGANAGQSRSCACR